MLLAVVGSAGLDVEIDNIYLFGLGGNISLLPPEAGSDADADDSGSLPARDSSKLLPYLKQLVTVERDPQHGVRSSWQEITRGKEG
tara:strand:+ start:127 stop:384 length:258 start_codon:yes stop_codon:yes gene_type:complete